MPSAALHRRQVGYLARYHVSEGASPGPSDRPQSPFKMPSELVWMVEYAVRGLDQEINLLHLEHDN